MSTAPHPACGYYGCKGECVFSNDKGGVAPSDCCGITTGKQTILFSIGSQIIICLVIYSRDSGFMLYMDWAPLVYLSDAMTVSHEIPQLLINMDA